MNFYQIFLPSFTLIYVLQIFVFRSWLQWRKTGINPFVFGKTETAHDYIGRVYKVMMVGTWVAIICSSFIPDVYHYLMPIGYLDNQFIQLSGLVLLVTSFIWIVVAQYQMSKSWRIGINYEEKTDLVSHGVFAYSRNPVFLGVLVSYLGTFLIIPNALTFATLWITYFIIQVQVRLEEEYLKSIHGDAYELYQRKTHRWL
ncbi:MAG: isoprenylcysteine carboxylmethyltransferase family protein [Reichenbachiella sp.]